VAGADQPAVDRRGADQAPGQGGGGDAASPAEISRRLAEEDPTLGSGRFRHGNSGIEVLDGDLAVEFGHGTTTTLTPDPTPDAAVLPELPADFDQSASPEPAPSEDTPLDGLAALDQAGNIDEVRANKPALWVTAVAFGALLLVSAAWLWARRGRYDPA
jgi:hypothetical protein